MRFKRIYIEITNTCNLHCSFCIQNSRKAQCMSIAQFSHIIEELRPYCDYLYLHVLGEPLSHPDLDAFLSMAIQAGFHINITTNGTLLKEKQEILKQHAIRQINVSLHSFPEHVQTNYLEDVFMVCEELAQAGIYINYRLWSLQDSKVDATSAVLLEAIEQRYARKLHQEEVHRMQRIALMDHISLHFEEVFTWPSLSQPFVNTTGRCLGMKDMCGILVNGDVVPCCLDSRGECTLGNIHTTAFETILQTSRARHMLAGYQKHFISEELCRHCTYRLRFSQGKGD